MTQKIVKSVTQLLEMRNILLYSRWNTVFRINNGDPNKHTVDGKIKVSPANSLSILSDELTEKQIISYVIGFSLRPTSAALLILSRSLKTVHLTTHSYIIQITEASFRFQRGDKIVS